MEVEAAGAQVGAGQSHEGQAGAVSTAADGHDACLEASLADCLLRVLDQVEVGLYLFLHVVVAVLQLQHHGARAVLSVQAGGDFLHQGLAGGELFAVMVADDVVQLGGGHIAAHLIQVEEALKALGVLGHLFGGQGGGELHGNGLGVLHQVLGAAGMHREAVHGDHRVGGIEVLVLQLAHVAAVHRVGELCAETVHVKEVGALAHLFVRGEADAELAVGDVLLLNTLHCGHNLGDAGLVVRAQQSGAVGGDQGLALPVGQLGEFFHGHVLAGTGKQHVAAVVVLKHLGLHVLAGGGGSGVHVRHKAQSGLFLIAGGGGQSAVHIALLIHRGIGHAQLLELLHQQVGQIKLAGGGGMAGALLVGGGVDGYILQKAFIRAHDYTSFLLRPLPRCGGRRPPCKLPFILAQSGQNKKCPLHPPSVKPGRNTWKTGIFMVFL